MENVAFKAGDTIICEGDEGDTAFFIVSGAVDVVVGHGANARTVGRLETGEVFGEMCLIEPGPRSATVRAACDTECLSASYQEFIASIEANPERAVGFMKTLVRRLRKMNELLECASSRAARISRHAYGLPAGRRLARSRRLVLDDAVVNSPGRGRPTIGPHWSPCHRSFTRRL